MKKQDTGFVQVKNEVLNDKTLSLKAKGLFAYLYGKPDTWDFSYKRIKLDHTDGGDSVMEGLKELEISGYLLRKKRKDGRVGYFLRWNKRHPWPTEKPDKENPSQGIPQSGKIPTISNTDSVLTKKNYNSNKEGRYKFSPKSNSGLIPIGEIITLK